MSVHYSSAAWKCSLRIGGLKLVLLKLADNSNDQGVSWPSLENICAETCLGLSTVCGHLAYLEAIGLVKRDKGNSARSTRYWLDLKKITGGADGRYQAGASHNGTLQNMNTSDSGDGLFRNGSQTLQNLKSDPSESEVQPSLNHQGTVNEPPKGGEGAASLPDKPAKPHGRNSVPEKPQKKERGRDEAFEALVEVQGGSLNGLTPSARGSINKALSEIRSVAPRVTAAEIRRRAEVYREKMRGATLTATALAAWWDRLGGGDREPFVVTAVETMDPQPLGWREAAAALYNFTFNSWEEVPVSNRTEIRAWLQKKKGAAHV